MENTSSDRMVPLSRFSLLVGVLVVAIVVSVAAVGVTIYLTPSPGPPHYPVVEGNLSVTSLSADAIPTPFLGVNARADFPITAQGAAIAATPARLVRWPGGGLADRLDPLALNGTGLIYGGAGTPYPASSSAEEFVAWCRSVGCAAVVTLPGEIDSPSYATGEVAYFVDALHFRPAYWEIGNEPALWSHWGSPWSDWQAGQNSTPGPVQYAQEVASYLAAIRTVDPTTPVLGLPGTGTGSSDETTWVEATVSINGPNLTAIAIHVYPAGTYASNVSPAVLFSSLESAAAVPARVAADEAAIRLACASCRISILVDEAAVESSATGGVATFSWVPYEAVEILQAIEANASGVLFWVAQGSYPGSWISGSGSPGLTYPLFQSMPNPFPSTGYPLGVVTVATGVYGMLFGTVPSHPSFVLLANTNVTESVHLDLSRVVPVGLTGTVLSWSGITSAPVASAWGAQSTFQTLLPDSVLMWEATA